MDCAYLRVRNKAGALYFGTASNMYLCSSRAVSSPSTRIIFHISKQSRNLRLSPTPWQAASQADKRISGLNDCPKECLCSRSIKADYKNVRLLSQFVSQQTGMILPRTVTKVCLTKQREIAKEIKKAVQMGFMPATYKLTAYLDDPKLF